jgi:hypothetical protein
VVTLALAGSGLHVATERSSTVLAAQLAADHAKCHWLERNSTDTDPTAVSDRLAARYGFRVRVPPGSPAQRLRLIGARRCLTGEGTNAHILYRYGGHPVSLYLLPGKSRVTSAVDVFGNHAYIWSRHNETFVLVADRSVAGLPKLAAYMRRSTE